MFGVDFGNDHGHVRGEAVGGIVGHDGDLPLCVFLFETGGRPLVHIDGAKDEIHPLCDLADVLFRVVNDHVRKRGGDGLAFKRPFALYRLRICLSRRTPGRRQRGHAEEGVGGEEEQKALSDHAGRADDAHVILFHKSSPVWFHFIKGKKKDGFAV